MHSSVFLFFSQKQREGEFIFDAYKMHVSSDIVDYTADENERNWQPDTSAEDDNLEKKA